MRNIFFSCKIKNSVLIMFQLKSPCTCSDSKIQNEVDKIKTVIVCFQDTPEVQNLLTNILSLWFPNNSEVEEFQSMKSSYITSKYKYLYTSVIL